MPMFEWQTHMVRFMKDASETSGYHAALAKKIAKYLPQSARVCDAGCGLGYLSLALSPYCQEVCAVDIAPQALAVLKLNIENMQIVNIRAICADMFQEASETPYDAMVFCFFGSISEAFRIAKAQCKGKLLLIKRDWDGHRFARKGILPSRHTLADVEAALKESGIPYVGERFALEMGQPFASLEDAALFFRTYGNEPEISEEEVKKRLLYRETDAKFPYYLPVENRLGLLVLDTGDIPDASINSVLFGG